jgi:alpha-glucosidase
VHVSAQRDDPSSLLCLTRDLIALRRSSSDLLSGTYAAVPSPAGVWAYRRGERTLVVLNLSDTPVAFDLGAGRIRLSTNRADDGEGCSGSRELAPWEAVVVERSG